MTPTDRAAGPAGGAAVLPRRRFRIREQTFIGYLFLAPAAIILLIMVGYPALAGVWYSFNSKMLGFEQYHFVGLGNYVSLIKDPRVLKAIGRGFSYATISCAVKLAIGMGVALLLNMRFRGRGLARGITLLPWSLPEIATVLLWTWMFNDIYGVLNTVLLKTGIIGSPINWLGTKWAFPSVILVNIWRGFPFFAINLLAGLQTIPEEVYEAASMDGANRWQAFWNVTLPGVRTVMLIVTLLSFIWTSNDFTSIWVLTHGGPAQATETFPIVTYELAFIGLEMGKAAAVPVLLMPFFSVLIVLLVKAVSGRED
jgi:multiple sugar transport system permease protein